MNEESLTQDLLKDLLDYDAITGIFTWKYREKRYFKTDRAWSSWNSKYAQNEAGSDSNGYILIGIFYVRYKAHRLAWLYITGRWPKNQIDHINGNGSDNRIENIRDVPQQENQRNASLREDNTSGVTGVSFHLMSGKWRATIRYDDKYVHLGTFGTKMEAVLARKQAEIKHGYHPNHGRKGVISV
jgi:hypothetical protein